VRLASDLSLARLFFWRALPAGAWCVLAIGLGLTLGLGHGSSELDLEQAAWLRRAELRQAAWALFGLFAAPLAISQCSRFALTWRQTDADWFGALPARQVRWVLGAALGSFLASLALSLSWALAIEASVQGDAPAGRFGRTLENPGMSLLPGESELHWRQPDLQLDELPAGSLVILRPSIMSGAGPSAEVALELRGEGLEPDSVVRTSALIFGPSRLALCTNNKLRGIAHLSIKRLAAGAPIVLPKAHVELVRPLASEHWISAELALLALSYLSAWCCLAAGLGAWMRPSLALALCLALLLVAW